MLARLQAQQLPQLEVMFGKIITLIPTSRAETGGNRNWHDGRKYSDVKVFEGEKGRFGEWFLKVKSTVKEENPLMFSAMEQAKPVAFCP